MSDGDDEEAHQTNSDPFDPAAPNGVLWTEDAELPLTHAGDAPVFYVYVFWHGDIPRYVGKGKNKRWFGHRKPEGFNSRKDAYFAKYWDEMECRKAAENLTEVEAFELEEQMIKEYGLLCDGIGTLLNLTYGGEGGVPSEETRVKHKAIWARPEVKAKQKATMARPEMKAKHRAATKAAMARPEVKAKQLAALARLDVKNRISAAVKAS